MVISRGALGVVISVCLGVGSTGGFALHSSEPKVPDHAAKFQELAVTDANLNGRITSIERRFEELKETLVRIEGKIDKVSDGQRNTPDGLKRRD